MTIEPSDGHEAINTQQTTGIHLRQLINILRRRRRVIIVAVIVAAGLAGAIGLVFPPRYTATAEAIVDPPKGSNGGADPSIAGVLDDSAVQTHVAALLSQDHLQHVFDSIVAERGPGPKEIGGVLQGLLGPEEFSIDNFTKRINAFKDAHSRMIGITYISTDPAFAAAVANRSMELYLATLTERNLADRNDALRSLSKRIPLVRAEVVRADAALQSYRIKHGFTEASRTDMVDQQLVDLNRQLAVARSDLAERHARPTALNIDQTSNQSQLAEESSTLRYGCNNWSDGSPSCRTPAPRCESPRRGCANCSVKQRISLNFMIASCSVKRQLSERGAFSRTCACYRLRLSRLSRARSIRFCLFHLPWCSRSIGAGLLAVLLEQLDGRCARNET